MLQKIRSSGVPGHVYTPYLRELATSDLVTMKRLTVAGMSDVALDLDSKIFTTLLEVALEKSNTRVVRELQTRCNEGAGREAIILLDELYQFNRDTVMTDAADGYNSLTCDSMKDLGEYLTNMRYYLDCMAMGGQPVNEVLLLSTVKKILKPYDERSNMKHISARYAEFEARPQRKRTVDALFAKLQTCYNEWAKDQEKNRKAKGAAARDSGPLPPCSHCGGKHNSTKCWTKFPHLRPDNGAQGGQRSSGPGGGPSNQGKGDGKKKDEEGKKKKEEKKKKWDDKKKQKDQAAAARGAAAVEETPKGKGKGKGTHPKCKYCGRNSHPEDECWYKGDGKGTRQQRLPESQ
jgi:hypothetical protein